MSPHAPGKHARTRSARRTRLTVVAAAVAAPLLVGGATTAATASPADPIWEQSGSTSGQTLIDIPWATFELPFPIPSSWPTSWPGDWPMPMPQPQPEPTQGPEPQPSPEPTQQPEPVPTQQPQPQPVPTTQPQPTQQPTQAPTSSPAPTSQPGPGQGKEANEVVRLTNEERKKAGCGPLTAQPNLVRSAQLHAEDMVKQQYFSHDGKDGSTPFDRMKRAGYQGSMMAENIAAGQPTPAEVMKGWMNSEGHRANILNCKLTQIGVGYDTGSVGEGMGNGSWVQNFGTP